MKLTKLGAAAMFAVALLTATVAVALAQEAPVALAHTATVVVAPSASSSILVPYGKWIAGLLSDYNQLIAAAIGTLIFGAMPAAYRIFLTPQQISHWVLSAIAQTEGAVAGKTMTVDVTNSVLHNAALLFIRNEGWIAQKMAGTIKPYALSWLSKNAMVPSDAHAANLDMSPVKKS
jgi:hypothetical protein